MILLDGSVIEIAEVGIVDDVIHVLELGSWLFDLLNLHLKCRGYLELLVNEVVMGSLAVAMCILASQREVIPSIWGMDDIVAIVSAQRFGHALYQFFTLVDACTEAFV